MTREQGCVFSLLFCPYWGGLHLTWHPTAWCVKELSNQGWSYHVGQSNAADRTLFLPKARLLLEWGWDCAHHRNCSKGGCPGLRIIAHESRREMQMFSGCVLMNQLVAQC